ncbi:hypothetical protein [Soonwooa sp.]|uniref:hypothetical protein n=1 Tax=Soonwooa sp. TaxID=1938592 RepID=UPI0028ABDF63|nr:hypothetical protein [Soonwooa sp.]
MDLHYQYCDDMKAVRFWDNLKDKLKDILNTLSENDKKTISLLCNKDNAQYFGLNF